MTEGFHRLDFRTHGHATEDEDRVRQAFTFVTGVEDPSLRRAAGYHGNPISVFTTTLQRPPEIRAFWHRVKAEDQLALLLEELESRVDGDGVLFFRFDKQEAYRGRLRLVRHDDVVSGKGKVAAFPARRERAIEAARAYLREV